MKVFAMNIKEYLAAIAIGILGALLIGLIVDYAYPNPEYDDFCENYARMAKPVPEGAQQTLNCPDPYFVYQEEVASCYKEKGEPRFEYNETGCQMYDYCEMCGKEFNEAQEKYARNLFFIISPIAVIGIIVGVYYTFAIVGSGFMIAGILLLIYSTARYFTHMSKLMRIIVIFVELLVVIFLAHKKLRKK